MNSRVYNAGRVSTSDTKPGMKFIRDCEGKSVTWLLCCLRASRMLMNLYHDVCVPYKQLVRLMLGYSVLVLGWGVLIPNCSILMLELQCAGAWLQCDDKGSARVDISIKREDST